MSWVKGQTKVPRIDREGVGKRITDLRLSMNMTQADLGKRTCIHRVSIQQYEVNKITPRSDNLAKIAEVLGTTTEYLMSGDEGFKYSQTVLHPWKVLNYAPTGRIICPYCGKGNGFTIRELKYNQLSMPGFCAWCGRKVMT
jgi:DNA-binding XRE family transcriptional regulator